MDDLDRERSSRSNETYRRRSTTSRTDATEFADIEPSSSATRSKGQSRSEPAEYDDYETLPPSRSSSSRQAEPTDRYSDRFRRTAGSASAGTDDAVDQSYRSTRDPYDRLRRVGNRPPRRVDVGDDADPYGYLDDEYDDRDGPAPRSRTSSRSRSQQRPSSARAAAAGMALARPTAELRPIVFGGAAALGSLFLLAILILVKSGSADAWLPMHLNAEGTPTVYSTTSAIWRLPFFALMSTITAVGLGWWLRFREPFAAQYLMVGALLVHAIIWVGTITLLW